MELLVSEIDKLHENLLTLPLEITIICEYKLNAGWIQKNSVYEMFWYLYMMNLFH